MAPRKGYKRSPNGAAGRTAVTVNLTQEHYDVLVDITEKYEISKTYAVELLIESIDFEVFEEVVREALETAELEDKIKNMSPEQIEKLKEMLNQM